MLTEDCCDTFVKYEIHNMVIVLTLTLFVVPFAVGVKPYPEYPGLVPGVEILSLFQNQLSGEIPPEIGLLTLLGKGLYTMHSLADCLPFFFYE